MKPRKLVDETIQAVNDFHARALWKRFTNYDCFAIALPDRDEPLLACVMGDAGEQFGLMLFRGPHAVEHFAALLDPDGPDDDATEQMDMLSFSMEDFGDLAPDCQAFYRHEGIHPRCDDQVPEFLVKRPYRIGRLPDDDELDLLLRATKAVVTADRRKLLKPAKLDDPRGICVITVQGDRQSPDVSVKRERPRPSRPAATLLFTPAPMDLAGLKRLHDTWLVATPSAPALIEGDDRSMQMLIAVDQASGTVLQGKPFFAGETAQAVQALVEAFRGALPELPKGLPERIIFSSRKLYQAVKHELESKGVTCTYFPAIPEIQTIMAELIEDMDDWPDPLDQTQRHDVPANNDLARWKQVDRGRARRFAQCLDYERLHSSRAVKRYFGDDDLQYYFNEYSRHSVISAYVTWGVIDYRPTRKSKTLAEMMLEEGLPDPATILLKALINSHPSIYRVARHDPHAGAIDLEDVLVGGAVTVCDQVLSENIEDNGFIVARVFPAGDFHFLDLVGPPLAPMMGIEAVEFLRDCGVEFTPQGLSRDAHIFGRLWDWREQYRDEHQLPAMRNLDGDDLVFHTASFSITDEQALRNAISRRPDIDLDQENGEFVWLRARGRAVKEAGGPIALGRIELLGDEMIFTTNSARRFDQARKWLDKLPGATFRNVEIRGIEEAMRNPRPGELLPTPPVELDPEETADLQKMIDRKYMEWLDTPLPLFSGQTPRQTCRTPAGKEKVAAAIRTIPDPAGDVNITVPRQAMLRELGLQSSPLPPNSFFPPPWLDGPETEPLETNAFHPAEKIGRNNPCPCGSGKKYKKCCGR